jgi:hypothetical protein
MIKSKELFQKSFRGRFSLRLHMSLILLATASSGILGSKLFHVLHVENLVIRYPLAVLLSYGVFFACIKLWLLYVSPAKAITSGKGDWLYVPSYSGHTAGGGSTPPLRGEGGEFSGAGASASFEDQSAITNEVIASPVAVKAPSTGGPSGGAGGTVSKAADALGDTDSVGTIVAIVVLATLVAAILGSAIYVVAEAPLILTDAAFNALFAASLVKRAHVIAGEDWVGSVLRHTWKPFGVTFAITFLAAAVLHAYFPQATSLAEVFRGR